MFDMKDFDNIKKPSERSEAPDFMSNDEEFINSMMTITRIIKDTDFEDHKSRASFMMHMMNMAVDEPSKHHERSLDVISALSSHIIMLIQALNGSKDAYIDHFNENVVVPMINDGPDMPVWGE